VVHAGRRLTGLLVALLVLLGSQVAGAFGYYKGSPQGDLGVTRPTVSQQFVLGQGESILRASMWLDGTRVEPHWDSTGLVSYTPPAGLAPGTHTVRLSVEVNPGTQGYRYDPVVSTFSFSVQPDAVELLPAPGPEELRALQWVNQYRHALGLEPMTFHLSLGASAERHARYLIANPSQQDLDPHTEQAGTPLYFGATGSARARYFGYGGGNSEVINWTQRAEEALDGWMSTIYHRLPLIYPGNTEMGYGVAAGSTGSVNVLETGPNQSGAGDWVAWPYNGQTDVPTAWDGLESPDPFRLYPGTAGPVGYTLTLTYPGKAGRLTMNSYSLTGPNGAVAVMPFDPSLDEHLSDTVALIPNHPLEPAARYTVTMAGQIDYGQGMQPYSRTWSFTTGAEQPPEVRRMSSRTLESMLTSASLEGSGFSPGVRVYLGGLPVEGLQVLSGSKLTFAPPAGLEGGPQEMLLVTPGGQEVLWRDFLSDPSIRFPAGTPFTSLPLLVHGEPQGAAALAVGAGGVLLPEQALAALGARRVDVSPIDRVYWTWGSHTADYTQGRAVATLDGAPFALEMPVHRYLGTRYVDGSFVSRLTGGAPAVGGGQVSVGMADLGYHWARAQAIRLLRDGIVSGTGDGRFQPDATQTRAAFVKMLTGARGLAPQPGLTGGFVDTTGHWVSGQGYIGAAVAAGLVLPGEYPGGRFAPDQAISREEMAVMVTRALGLEEVARARSLTLVNGAATIAGHRFTDAATWVRPGYIAAAVEAGIITGYPEEGGSFTFRPTRSATRAEAVVMTVRMLDRTP
jgi:hypothetical protein